jgi:hypothetical protein
VDELYIWIFQYKTQNVLNYDIPEHLDDWISITMIKKSKTHFLLFPQR